MRLDYVLMDPTGNVTALVKTPVPAARQPDCARAVMAAEPAAEQVGFLSAGDGAADLTLRMAGGEFCGNATMSAASLFCAERALDAAELRVRVSGADAPVRVTLRALPDGGYACAETLPRCAQVEEAALTLDGADYRLPLLRLGGIAHLILPGDFDRALAARAAAPWCAALGAAALGLMLLDEAAGTLTPLVYVPGADTLYWERSCASGTAAAGAYLAWKSGAATERALAQPGGVLRVSAQPLGDIVLHGAVKMLHVGQIPLKHP